MFAKMKAEQFEGHLATRADIWVNGWYPGDPIEFDIFPPPRQSPDSVLTLNKPVDADAAFNVNVEFNFAPASAPDHIHVTFTASPRNVNVTDAGEMILNPAAGMRVSGLLAGARKPDFGWRAWKDSTRRTLPTRVGHQRPPPQAHLGRDRPRAGESRRGMPFDPESTMTDPRWRYNI